MVAFSHCSQADILLKINYFGKIYLYVGTNSKFHLARMSPGARICTISYHRHIVRMSESQYGDSCKSSEIWNRIKIQNNIRHNNKISSQ